MVFIAKRQWRRALSSAIIHGIEEITDRSEHEFSHPQMG